MTQSEDDKRMVAHYLETILRESTEIQIRQHNVHNMIVVATQRGATWKQVGASLGISPQAAWKQHGPDKVRKINGVEV